MIRIGIPTQGFRDWAGGIDFLFSIVDSLRAAGADVELHLLDSAAKPLGGWRRLRSAVQRRGAAGGSGAADSAGLDCSAIAAHCDAAHHVPYGSEAIATASARLRLDAVLPSHGVLSHALQCPWIGYIYDFQHRILPHLFTDRQRTYRDEGFARMIAAAPAIVVNSRDTAAEARRLYPHAAHRIHALPFNASPRPEWLGNPPGNPVAFATPFFLISNQFWMHKDHPTAFRAFARIAHQRPDVRLVCTGQTSDYRRPDYFNTLVALIDSLGIRDRVTITGLLPKWEQIELLKNAVAVVQPTLCEGGPGGGAVYDAVSLGVRAIVSDIAINLELTDEPTVGFFRVGDPEALAAAMLSALQTRPTPIAAAVLRDRGRARRAACGRKLLEIVAGTGATAHKPRNAP